MYKSYGLLRPIVVFAGTIGIVSQIHYQLLIFVDRLEFEQMWLVCGHIKTVK